MFLVAVFGLALSVVAGVGIMIMAARHFALFGLRVRMRLARRRHLRESVSHPERVCHRCGGHATRLEAMQFPHKIVYYCRDRKTCEKTLVNERMLGSMY